MAARRDKDAGGGARAQGRKRVTHKELCRRIGTAIDAVHEAARGAIGDDVDPTRRSRCLMWAFGYLIGAELGHLTYLTGDHQSAELAANKAMASGLDEYASALGDNAPPEEVSETVALLREVARRIGGARRRGRPHLVVMAEGEAPEPVATDEGDAIRF